jgi:hypothetical protein
MKTVKFTVEFLQPSLASGTRDQEVSTFPRSSDGRIIFQDSWWHSALCAALQGTVEGAEVNASDIRMDPELDAETETYTRRYNGTQQRKHECIPAGANVTFCAALASNVSMDAFHTIMDRLGRFIGISPFGHRLGYGKFKIVGGIENG